MRRIAFAIATMGVALGGGSLASPAMAQETVQGDGSSTVFPVTEAVAEEFQNGTDYRMTVGVSGTGGGFSKFCRGETDLSGASRPIRPGERDKCEANGIEYFEVPVAMDAMGVYVNPRNDWVDHLTVKELKKVWRPEAEGEITNWNQIREEFPDRELNLYGAGTDSGTYDYFTAAIVGKEHSSRGDFMASEDDNVLVQGIANDPNALGFFGLAYWEQNQDKLKRVPISYKGSDPVIASVENASNGTYQPLTRPLFMYVKKSAYENKESLQKFVHDYMLNADLMQSLVREVGYVPLPDKAFTQSEDLFENGNTGTVYASGSQIGVSIQDLLEMERSN
ncbi:MAG: PstS family phosphate ABC transporter substrate-binding protein [Rhodovibrio sp.]|nr:PstS family phosphate ABC transporter substrate-binding protein [Rhodovibrio sp.]